MKSYFMELKEIIKTLKRIKRKSNKNKNDANHGGYQAHLGGLLEAICPIRIKPFFLLSGIMCGRVD